MNRPSRPRIESSGDIGIASVRRVLRKNKSSECRASPLYDEEPHNVALSPGVAHRTRSVTRSDGKGPASSSCNPPPRACPSHTGTAQGNRGDITHLVDGDVS